MPPFTNTPSTLCPINCSDSSRISTPREHSTKWPRSLTGTCFGWGPGSMARSARYSGFQKADYVWLVGEHRDRVGMAGLLEVVDEPVGVLALALREPTALDEAGA